ncbi:hypothetical protein CY0110_19062 [Crocosphaera chwakensis CCY0110]|uniref:Uncharacterized protein n=1 Tax=Crocosphaera chwakensis CCY0110 TaxID=391612 RepID=A3IJE4_9CHRO|nr:hypothetical protein CY0110_19062 [Crocosphaera chwakensis CCY0110]
MINLTCFSNQLIKLIKLKYV